jgi:uncharacterized membrane protein
MSGFLPVIGSERALRIVLAVIALVGLGVAIYLTTTHYQHDAPVCLAGGEGCAQVQESEFSELAGVPVPLIGIFGYLTVLAAAALPGDVGRFGGLFAGIVGVSFSAYLTYLELFEINAICQWCVASAVLMTIVFVVTLLRAIRYGGRGNGEAVPDRAEVAPNV